MGESRCVKGIGSQTALGGRHEGDDRRRRLVAEARGDRGPGGRPRPRHSSAARRPASHRDWLTSERVRLGGGSAAGPMVAGRSACGRSGLVRVGSGRVDSIRRSRRGRGEPAQSSRRGRGDRRGGWRSRGASHATPSRVRPPGAGRSAPGWCRPQLSHRLGSPGPRRDIRNCGVMTS